MRETSWRCVNLDIISLGALLLVWGRVKNTNCALSKSMLPYLQTNGILEARYHLVGNNFHVKSCVFDANNIDFDSSSAT